MKLSNEMRISSEINLSICMNGICLKNIIFFLNADPFIVKKIVK